VVLHDPKQNLMRRHVLESPAPPRDHPINELTIEEAPAGWVWQTQQPMLITDLGDYESRYPRVIAELREYGVKTAYILPLTSLGRRLGRSDSSARRKPPGAKTIRNSCDR
jgi:formate hydrogenlyase transcriptional activator